MGTRAQAPEVGVVVKDGVLALTGWVDSYTKRRAAEIEAAAVRALQWDALLDHGQGSPPATSGPETSRPLTLAPAGAAVMRVRWR